MQVKTFPTLSAASRAATPFAFPHEGLSWRTAGSKGKERSRLIASVQFLGCMFHLEAFQVRQVGTLQECTTPIGASVVATLRHAFGCDGPMATATIEGFDYVITMTPFAD